MRTLTAQEIQFLTERTQFNDNLENARKSVDLIRESSIESLCEVVLNPNSNYICSVIAHYLNNNTDRLGFTQSVAVEKMARVKRAPYAINEMILNPAEQAFIEKVQTDIIERIMKNGF